MLGIEVIQYIHIELILYTVKPFVRPVRQEAQLRGDTEDV